VKKIRGRLVDVDSVAELDRRIATGVRRLTGWHLVGLDLSAHGGWLRRVDVAGALFLGCRLHPGDEQSLRSRGAVVFPEPPGSPVEAYRSSLYTPAELYGDDGYEHSLDARAYAWSHRPTDRERALAQALHDHAIDEALGGWVAEQVAAGRPLVGVMGGHALTRAEPAFAEAARLGQLIGASVTVATGGGPGAMEAANLGARLAHTDAGFLSEVLSRIAVVPSYHPDIHAWASVALDVSAELTDPGVSLGVPTWHYGHEPPNVWATAVAKYFTNALREAVLLQICDAGVIFLPGAAGTAQEIFQDACENYYADPGAVAPMVLVGRRHWTETVPAWQLLEGLAAERPLAEHIHLVDSVEEAAEVILGG
jgi:predicted Rossmann-fold nucleotide-binding protein